MIENNSPGNTPVVAKDHKRLCDEVDDIFSEALHGRTNLLTFMKSYNGKGNIVPIFNEFYQPFCDLFEYTRYLPAMADVNKQLISNIERWMKYDNGKREPSNGYMLTGTDLFSQYAKYLIEKGIVQIKR